METLLTGHVAVATARVAGLSGAAAEAAAVGAAEASTSLGAVASNVAHLTAL